MSCEFIGERGVGVVRRKEVVGKNNEQRRRRQVAALVVDVMAIMVGKKSDSEKVSNENGRIGKQGMERILDSAYGSKL